MFSEIADNIVNNDNTLFIIYATLMAGIGGIANWILSEEHSFSKFMTGIFLAGFAGFLTGQICIAFNIESSWAFFISGSSGLAGETILRLSRQYVINKFGGFLQEKYEDEAPKQRDCYESSDEIDEIEKKYKKQRNDKKE